MDIDNGIVLHRWAASNDSVRQEARDFLQYMPLFHYFDYEFEGKTYRGPEYIENNFASIGDANDQLIKDIFTIHRKERLILWKDRTLPDSSVFFNNFNNKTGIDAHI